MLCFRILLGLVMLLITSTAHAARHVSAVMIGSERDSRELEKVFAELLGRSNVTLSAVRADTFDVRTVVTPKGQSDEALLARVWIDLRGNEQATLYLADRAWERILIRTVPLQGPNDEVAREQLGHILQAAAETLLAGGVVGRPRLEVQKELGVEPPPPRPAPRAPPPKPRLEPPPAHEPEPALAPVLSLATGWELWGYSADEPVAHGPNLRLEVEFLDGPWRPGAAVSAAYHLPIITSDQPIDVRIDTLALRLRAQLAYLLHQNWRLVGALGGGLDMVHLDPRSDVIASEPSPQRWTRVPLMNTSLGVRWQLLESLAFEAAAALELTLVDSRYVVTVRGQKRTALDPWTVRPGGALAVVWSP